jgi:cytochrome c553
MARSRGLGDVYKRQGQHADYVVTQLKAFYSGERANDNAKVMRMIAAKMSDADMAAVADYIQGLH